MPLQVSITFDDVHFRRVKTGASFGLFTCESIMISQVIGFTSLQSLIA
ncbi:MAG: hypothetical protein ACOYMF_15875 [Bacteroidales bacterium]